MKGHFMSLRFRICAWLIALPLGAAVAACGAPRDDEFVLVRRVPQAPAAPTLLQHADDAGAARVRRLMSDGYCGELLRTFAMARRLAGEGAGPRQQWRTPAGATYLALGASDRNRLWPDRRRILGGGWWRREIRPDAPMVWIDDDSASAGDPVARDAFALRQITGGFGRAIADVLDLGAAPAQTGAAFDPLVEGYVKFLDVVGAEWRSAGATAADAEAARAARTRLQRAPWFAAVRENQGVPGKDAWPKIEIEPRRWVWHGSWPEYVPPPSGEVLLRNPTVVATFLYRLAASPAGRRLAPDAVYRPFVDDLPPKGFSAGQLLGAFRGFQAKLLAAWFGARQAGHAPRDLVDLVEVYASAYPDERAEVTRIFLVTTYGLTAQAGGVSPRLPPETVASQLASLTADVLFGRSQLRSNRRY